MNQNIKFVAQQTVSDIIRVKTKLEIGDNVITPEEVQISSPATFSGPVTFQNEVHGISAIKTITCDACENEFPGFEFEGKTICLHCIRDIAIQFRAKESWVEKNGDPMKNCLDMIKKLQEELTQCKAEIEKLKKSDTVFDSGGYLSQYL